MFGLSPFGYLPFADDGTKTGSASASGFAQSVAYSLSGGVATGAASANGYAGAITYSLAAGAATAGDAAAAGSAQVIALSVSGGAATGDAAATGESGTIAYSLAAGAASSSGTAEAAGSDLSLVYVLSAGAATAANNGLHSRRIRGRVIRFDDELLPVAEVAAKVARVGVPTLPALAPIAGQIEAAKREVVALAARIEAQREAKARKAQIDALMTELAGVLAALEQARAVEAAWIKRLRDDDEFFLLAA